jgi:hypothetical protein
LKAELPKVLILRGALRLQIGEDAILEIVSGQVDWHAEAFLRRVTISSSVASANESRRPASRQGSEILAAALSLGIVAYTPNPVGRVHPGVGHTRIADAPSGAWTNERHDPQM